MANRLRRLAIFTYPARISDCFCFRLGCGGLRLFAIGGDSLRFRPGLREIALNPTQLQWNAQDC